ncbi:recombinase family protein [Auritidibacter sp. NML100628]|uniref:recombinase family protein n=1 Tax=Auritidibacter sp. NML100628 TaxID=2170742 RepID=UPI001F25AA97|nr:recombinase family protein [Auritidibacter sp. NML100628]
MIRSRWGEFLRAEADADTMRERQLRTVKLNAERGRPYGRLPYGYRRIYDQLTGVLLRPEPDPHKGEIVREAAREVLAGKSLHSVAMRLQDGGEPTPMKSWTEAPRGWEANTVHQVLENPTIAGKRVYQGEVIGDAQQEPLIDWKTFPRLQRLFADPGRRVKGGGGTQAKTLMTHIAKCHYCGRPLKRAVLRRKHQADAVKYYCAFRGCYKITIAQQGLDDDVEEAVLTWFESPENLARLTGDDGNEWIANAQCRAGTPGCVGDQSGRGNRPVHRRAVEPRHAHEGRADPAPADRGRGAGIDPADHRRPREGPGHCSRLADRVGGTATAGTASDHQGRVRYPYPAEAEPRSECLRQAAGAHGAAHQIIPAMDGGPQVTGCDRAGCCVPRRPARRSSAGTGSQLRGRQHGCARAPLRADCSRPLASRRWRGLGAGLDLGRREAAHSWQVHVHVRDVSEPTAERGRRWVRVSLRSRPEQ